ncbi:MAG: hypothetical protein WCD20_02315 [Rhodomicrobium sp.]
MRTPAVLAISLLLSGNTLAKDAAGLFDKPAKVTKVPLAADPQNPQSKPMLSCFYFANFAVKQIDRGEVGAEQLSVVPLGGAEPYQCREANIAGEKVVDVKEWSGYFKGVKGNYVFFDADDGLNGGLGFAVFDASDGKKLFEDTTKGLHAIKLTPAGMVLKYTRVYAPGCSLFADAAGCWAKVKQGTGLTQASPPDCAAAYKAEEKRMKGSSHSAASVPSVVQYEVETVLNSGQTKVSAAPGQVSCRLSD